MRTLGLMALLMVVAGGLLAGCNSAQEVSEQDARSFSQTPGGKDDGRDEVNNNR